MILLVIDMQKALIDDELYAFDTFMERTARLIDAARKNNVEVIYVQHDAGAGSGFSVGDEAFEIAEEVAPREGEKVFIKTINSCFGNSFEVIIPEGTNSTFANDYMTGETTVKYYNEDVWEEIVESVTMEEAIEMMGR